MPTTETDWRDGIIDAARPCFAGRVGAVIVGIGAKGFEFRSRFFALSDYADSRKLRSVVWARATRYQNEDLETNYYVVNRYEDGTLVAYNSMHSILRESGGEA